MLWGSSLELPIVTTLFDVVSEVLGPARPPKAFLHDRSGVMLALMGCVLVAAIKGSAPVPLGNNKLKYGLTSRSQVGFMVKEAIFNKHLFLRFDISHSGFPV